MGCKDNRDTDDRHILISWALLALASRPTMACISPKGLPNEKKLKLFQPPVEGDYTSNIWTGELVGPIYVNVENQRAICLKASSISTSVFVVSAVKKTKL